MKKYQIILILVWAALLLFCLLNKDRFTVDGVLSYTPENAVLSAAFMMFLFALKSISVFIFSGILFAANGILFPLPAAILLNVLGAAVMVSLPYWLGRRLGGDVVGRIVEKYPKAAAFRQLQTGHELLFSFIARAVNILPSDIVSLYMGAMGISYRKYLPGSILGMLLSLITFPIMGMNIANPGSPTFLWSIGIQAAVSAVSIGGFWLVRRKKKDQ
ncbi:MAG: TVP38/TMEM64 family protein [Oscillospiraceae bacterium]|nr:TVP38/TMEM64 family protein [Oscillospiraceae bacterium]